jgi:hypothetical protein
MGKKQQEAIKAEQIKKTFQIYHLPQTDAVIKQVIQDIHSKEYERVVQQKKGKETLHIPFKAMERPGLMFPKYLYILHYLIRRMLQFKYEYAKAGSGISVADLRKRICVDTSMASLMLDVLQRPEYNLIVKTEKHSKERKKASKYRLSEELEQLVGDYESAASIPTFVLNRRDHGKMVDRLIQFSEEGKTYNEGEKAEKERATTGKTSNHLSNGDPSTGRMPSPTEATSVKTSPTLISLEYALRYFEGLHKAKLSPETISLGDIYRAINKRMEENTALPPEKKEQLLHFLPDYIKSIGPSYEFMLEKLFKDLQPYYSTFLSMSRHLPEKINRQDLPEKIKNELIESVTAFLKLKFSAKKKVT